MYATYLLLHMRRKIHARLYTLLLYGFLPAIIATMPFGLQAAHIIGGEINYECLGNNQYRFRLKLYRDCAGGGAPFDSAPGSPFPATITIYREDQEYTTIALSAPTITNIPPDLSNPCLIPPSGICVEEGIYTFVLELPYTGQPYHIVYQRCCRNNTISNITNPGNNGATFYMELTPLAQLVCNSSPVFDTFPPIVICRNDPINFNFSATDPDGDQLVYSFCAPYLGGGPDSNFPEDTYGVAPNPDAPPPYNQVNFISPYSVDNPLGTTPPMTIDSIAGIIDGIPEFLGQFVVGVCIKEYRDGQLLSVTRRDFQFNVANCDPTIVAQIASDEILSDDTFALRSCGNHTVQFDNQSYLSNFIYETVWQFDLGNGEQATSEEWSPQITFPGIGTFYGKLLLNPGSACSDTADIRVSIFPEITADFSFAYDTCLADSIFFTDLSVSGAGPQSIQQWNWHFGDGQTSELQHPVHYYTQPGSMEVVLTVTDTNLCRAEKTRILEYYPSPSSILIIPDSTTACVPANITFNNLSTPLSEAYDIQWNFGDGHTAFGVSPSHLYETPGTYSVYLSITSPTACFTDTTLNPIEILPSPMAGFTYSPQNPSNFDPEVHFTDESVDATSWFWDFDGWGNAYLPNPVFSFPDTGLQAVTQIVTHLSGCTDTLTRLIDIEPLTTYFLPNAFTPNADGINDGFRGTGHMQYAREFLLQIRDRYGALIFETNDPQKAWDGTTRNGQQAPPGTYLLTVHYLEPRGKEVNLKGTVLLIR